LEKKPLVIVRIYLYNLLLSNCGFFLETTSRKKPFFQETAEHTQKKPDDLSYETLRTRQRRVQRYKVTNVCPDVDK